jgi:hypothetical protein
MRQVRNLHYTKGWQMVKQEAACVLRGRELGGPLQA